MTSDHYPGTNEKPPTMAIYSTKMTVLKPLVMMTDSKSCKIAGNQCDYYGKSPCWSFSERKTQFKSFSFGRLALNFACKKKKQGLH
jgi:hypothetical protein